MGVASNNFSRAPRAQVVLPQNRTPPVKSWLHPCVLPSIETSVSAMQHCKKRGVSSTPFCCHTCGVHAHLQIKCGNHTKLCSVHAHFMRLVWLAHHIFSAYTLYPVGAISTQNRECSLKVYTCNTCSVQAQVTSTPSTYGVHAHFR